VSINVEYEGVCALSHGGIANDLQGPLATPNHPIFCISNRDLSLPLIIHLMTKLR